MASPESTLLAEAYQRSPVASDVGCDHPVETRLFEALRVTGSEAVRPVRFRLPVIVTVPPVVTLSFDDP
jgi:hypothetical protein